MTRVRRYPEKGHAQEPRQKPQPSRRHVTALPACRSPDEAPLEGRADAIFIRDVVELLDEPRWMDVTYGDRLRTGLSTGTAAGGA